MSFGQCKGENDLIYFIIKISKEWELRNRTTLQNTAEQQPLQRNNSSKHCWPKVSWKISESTKSNYHLITKGFQRVKRTLTIKIRFLRFRWSSEIWVQIFSKTFNFFLSSAATILWSHFLVFLVTRQNTICILPNFYKIYTRQKVLQKYWYTLPFNGESKNIY